MCEVRVPKPRSNREMHGLPVGSRQAVDVRVGVRFCTVFLSFFTVEGLRLFSSVWLQKASPMNRAFSHDMLFMALLITWRWS
jgi:hypothetical protein